MKLLENPRKIALFEGWLSAMVNILLFVAKIWAGTITGSIAMIADAWHTLSDTVTSAVVIAGAWISSKPADKGHPFGHGRAESIASIVISTLLALVGVKFLLDSGKNFINHKTAMFSLTGILIFAISAVIKEGMAQFAIRAGKKMNLQSVVADGWHHRSDAVASLLIVIGAIIGEKIWWIDSALGLVVSLLILKAAYEIFKSSSDLLIGRQIDSNLENEVRKIIRENLPEILDVHHFHLHEYGEHKELTFHVSVDGNANLFDAHALVDKLEKLICNNLKLEVTIHIDPQ